MSAEFLWIQQIQVIHHPLATAMTGTKDHYAPRKYAITVVPQMVELAISGPVCAKTVLRIVLIRVLRAFVLREKMPTTNLATSATTMVHVAMLQENARVLWMEKSMQTVVKAKNTHHALQLLAVLVNASTQRIVSDAGFTGEHCDLRICPEDCNWNEFKPQGECFYDEEGEMKTGSCQCLSRMD